MTKNQSVNPSTVRALSKKFESQAADLPPTNYGWIIEKTKEMVRLMAKKNAEYGASWRRRGGIGAFFTIWRKADRLEEQLKARGYNIFDVNDDPTSTESLDETLLDLWNYLGLVIESRNQIREMSKALPGSAGPKDPIEDPGAPDRNYTNQDPDLKTSGNSAPSDVGTRGGSGSFAPGDTGVTALIVSGGDPHTNTNTNTKAQ